MSEDPNAYRPRSPDLPTYRAQPPRLASYDANTGFPQGYNLTHRASFDASPYFSPQTPLVSQAAQSYFPTQILSPTHSIQPRTSSPRSIHNQLQGQRIPSKSFGHPPPNFFDSSEASMPRKRISDDEGDYAPDDVGRSNKKRKPDVTSHLRADAAAPSLGCEVKTKFPVARIKRIMQADEDVGKVAQATPTAVSKALELFMIALVTKAGVEAKNRQSKRITAAHLKQAVLADNNLDFLQDIVSRVPDPTEKPQKSRAKSEDSADGLEVEMRKKRNPVRRKKATSADDD